MDTPSRSSARTRSSARLLASADRKGRSDGGRTMGLAGFARRLGCRVVALLRGRTGAEAARSEGGGAFIGASSPRVRPVRRSDIDRLCPFLQHRWPKVGADAWRKLFEYAWLDDKPNLGFVLTVGDEIVGFQGAVYARRRINGKAGLVCNLTSWCVLPEYRGWSIALVMAALRDRSMSYTCLTPAPLAVQVLKRFGLAPLETRKIAMPPFLHAHTLRADAQIISDPDRIRDLLDDEQRQIFDDHAPYGCLQLVLSDQAVSAYFVVKRRAKRGLPISELLYCSAPDLLTRHLERVKLTVLRRQCTLALVADARFFPASRPLGIPFRHPFKRQTPTVFCSPIFGAGELDNLYSELVLLPI